MWKQNSWFSVLCLSASPCFLFFSGRRKREKVLACASTCVRNEGKRRCFQSKFLMFFTITANCTEVQRLSFLNNRASFHFQRIIPALLLEYLHLRHERLLGHTRSRAQEVLVCVSWKWCPSAEKQKKGLFHAVQLH